MNIPKSFVPKNSDEKLENLLKNGPKKRPPKKEYGLSKNKYEYYCADCNKFAGSIEIIFEEDRKSSICWPSIDFLNSALVINNFLGPSTMYRSEEFLESIMEYLENEDLKAVLKKLNGNNLDFYCPTCDECYCGDHRKAHSK